MPVLDILLKDVTISDVTAANVALTPLESTKYALLGITAIGHPELTELVR